MLELREHEILSPYAAFSDMSWAGTERKRNMISDHIPEGQGQIHSKARRLKYKTWFSCAGGRPLQDKAYAYSEVSR